MNERKKHRSGNIKYKTSREELKEFPYNGSFVLMENEWKKGRRGEDKDKAEWKERGKALVVNERPTRNRVYISQGFRKGWLWHLKSRPRFISRFRFTSLAGKFLKLGCEIKGNESSRIFEKFLRSKIRIGINF